jgi:hypothetical protein
VPREPREHTPVQRVEVKRLGRDRGRGRNGTGRRAVVPGEKKGGGIFFWVVLKKSIFFSREKKNKTKKNLHHAQTCAMRAWRLTDTDWNSHRRPTCARPGPTGDACRRRSARRRGRCPR